MSEPVYRHICEVCGKTEDLTSSAGFDAGWDYPPAMGAFGVVSPRTCGGCTIENTLWWRMTTGQVTSEADLTEADMKLIQRIQTEPASILVTN